MRFNLTYFTSKSKVHQNPKYTMPSKYQTDQYPTHSTNTTQLNKSDLTPIMWPDNSLHPNWLDLILPNTVLPCPIQLYQPLSLLSRTLSLYICLITSYHYQIQIQVLFNYVSTQMFTTPCSVFRYRIPGILPFHLQPFFVWPIPSSALSKQIPTHTHLNRHTCTYPTFRNAILVITPT